MCNYYESSLFTTKLMMILFSLLVILFQYEQSIALYTGCPRTGSPEKTGMCRQQKRL
jgi:hypothetical protein